MICKLRLKVRENGDIAGIVTENNETCWKMITGHVIDTKLEIFTVLECLQSPTTSFSLMKLTSCLELALGD